MTVYDRVMLSEVISKFSDGESLWMLKSKFCAFFLVWNVTASEVNLLAYCCNCNLRQFKMHGRPNDVFVSVQMMYITVWCNPTGILSMNAGPDIWIEPSSLLGLVNMTKDLTKHLNWGTCTINTFTKVRKTMAFPLPWKYIVVGMECECKTNCRKEPRHASFYQDDVLNTVSCAFFPLVFLWILYFNFLFCDFVHYLNLRFFCDIWIKSKKIRWVYHSCPLFLCL